MKALRTLRPLLVLLALALGAPAFAAHTNPDTIDPALRESGGLLDGSSRVRERELVFLVGMPDWYGGWGFGWRPLGLGVRASLPLLHNGLLPDVNDSLGLEVGADLSFWAFSRWATFLDIPVELKWSLYLVPKVAVFLKLGIALEMQFGQGCWGNTCYGSSFFVPVPVAAVGLAAQMTSKISLRLEFGYPWFKIGIGVPF